MQKINQEQTLSDVLDRVCEPDNIDERIERLQVAALTPAFYAFIKNTFAPDEKYSLIEGKTVKLYNPNTRKGRSYSMTWADFINKELIYFTDRCTLRTRVKNSRFYATIDEVRPSDATLLVDMMRGQFVYSEKLNQLVAKAAFPELFPK